MNEKITFPRLAALLSDRSGRSKRFSEDFLREFFALISERLEAGDSVKVKGLGTFRLSRVEPRRSVDVTTGQPMEISGHSKVVFIPAKELAEAVNSPFIAFTAIEISDDADISQLFSNDEIDLQENEDPEEDIVETEPIGAIDAEKNEIEETPLEKSPDVEEKSLTEYKSMMDAQSDQKVAEEMASVENLGEPVDGPSEEEASSVEEETKTEEAHVDKEALQSMDSQTEESSTIEEETSEKEIVEENPTEERSETEEDSETEYDDDLETQGSRRKTWVRTLMISLGAAIFALIATFAVWYLFATNDFNRLFNHKAANSNLTSKDGFVVGKKVVDDEQKTPDIVLDSTTDTLFLSDETEVPTAPSDAIVYDTISTTRYLTTMAKAHYGNYNLWPYIYEENKEILGHPDRIRPGTPVVIPKLSKYGVDPSNQADIEKAKKMGVEIYARYNKKI